MEVQNKHKKFRHIPSSMHHLFSFYKPTISIFPFLQFITESFLEGWTEAADASLFLDGMVMDQPISEGDEDADNNNTNNKTRKRRKGRDSVEDSEILDTHGGPQIDNRLIEMMYPKQYEAEFATAIFEVGLKNSSPKVLMALMPSFINLSTEHLKSHLQKVWYDRCL